MNVSRVNAGFWVAQALSAASSLGLLDELRDGQAKSVEVLAARLDLNVRTVSVLVNALAASDILDNCEPGKVKLPPEITVSDEFAWRGLIASTRINDNLWQLFSHLEKQISQGVVSSTAAYYEALTSSESKDFALTMHYQAQETARLVAEHWLSFVGHTPIVADIGAGLGTYSIELLKANVAVRALLIDREEVLALATLPYIAYCGFQDRAQPIYADLFHSPELVADAILFGRILHDWSDGQIMEMIGSWRGCLRTGGALVIVEEMFDTSGAAWPAMLDLYLWRCLGDGRIRSPDELRRLLRQAEFSVDSITPLADGYGMVVARPE